jgi:hypothetical protein
MGQVDVIWQSIQGVDMPADLPRAQADLSCQTR